MTMKQILFVQGGGDNVHEQWDDKLVDSLRRELGDGYDVIYPTMPNEADPNFEEWRAALEAEIGMLDDGAVLVGHSVGGTILINMLAAYEPPIALGSIILLAAPFIGEGGWQSDDITPRPAVGADLPRDVPVHLFHGESDETVPVAHVALYARAIPQARVHRVAGRDHQFNNDLAAIAHLIRER